MTKPSTETLQKNLEELVNKHNEAVTVQSQCKEQIIAIQAVLQDRSLEDGLPEDKSS